MEQCGDLSGRFSGMYWIWLETAPSLTPKALRSFGLPYMNLESPMLCVTLLGCISTILRFLLPNLELKAETNSFLCHWHSWVCKHDKSIAVACTKFSSKFLSHQWQALPMIILIAGTGMKGVWRAWEFPPTMDHGESSFTWPSSAFTRFQFLFEESLTIPKRGLSDSAYMCISPMITPTKCALTVCMAVFFWVCFQQSLFL